MLDHRHEIFVVRPRCPADRLLFYGHGSIIRFSFFLSLTHFFSFQLRSTDFEPAHAVTEHDYAQIKAESGRKTVAHLSFRYDSSFCFSADAISKTYILSYEIICI